MYRARRALTRAAVTVAIWGLTWPATAAAQFDDPPAPSAYALQGVTLVQADGTARGGLTVVIRGGLIEAIGADVEVPPDAEVLEGDSLMVYPGLIDAQGSAKVEFPAPETDREELESWNPPRTAQGFVAHRRVSDHLVAVGSDLKSQRTKGVVAAAVHPTGPVMPGRGAFLLFRKKTTSPVDLVLTPELGPVFTFQGARGAYPATLFAVVAFIRQSLEDARHHGLALAAHQRDPRGLSTPTWDPDYQVLRAVLNGELPVYFVADNAGDIRQVLALAGEYEFRPVVVGGQEAWKLAPQLRERRVPVLVSLDFPEPERWKPDEAAEEEEPADTAAAEAVQEEPLAPAAQREKERLENIYASAGRLASAGVQVALTSGGGEADLLEGARKAIEYGMTEQQALAALTAAPAALYGVPHLSRIEVGLPATFIVTDGPLFAEDTRIAYTFVEGALEEGAASRAATPEEAPAVDVSGTWEVRIRAGGESVGGTMSLAQEGAEFTGNLEMEIGRARIESGVVSGDKVTFVLVVSMGGETMEMDVKGTVEGDEASGSGSGPMGSFTWRATRTGTPNEEVR